MPKKTRTRKRKTNKMKGAGLLGDVWSGLKKTYNVLHQVKPSQYIGLIPHPYAKGASAVLSSLGMGKRRKK